MGKIKLGLFLLLSLLIFSLLFMGNEKIDTTFSLLPPSPSHPFGTDYLGRDLLSISSKGLIFSFLLSFITSCCATIFALLFTFLNSTKYLFVLSSSLVKTLKVIPSTIFAIFLVSIFGNGAEKIVISLSLVEGASLSVILSSLVKRIKSENYVIAARSTGLRESKIFIKHIIPSLFPYIKENFALNMIRAIISESSLSYLALGVSPTTITLGSILKEGRAVILSSPFVTIFPSLLLLLLTFSIFLISRGISELYSPT